MAERHNSLLDSDAIVLKNPTNLPQQLNFKVGVTPITPNLMPINEGVIIAKAKNVLILHIIWEHIVVKDDKIIQKSQERLALARGQQSMQFAVQKWQTLETRKSY